MSERKELDPCNQLDAEVVVSLLMASPVQQIWQILMSTAGAEIVLGPGAQFGEKGRSWASDNGRTGVIRTLHPWEVVRFTWRENEQSSASMVRIDLIPQEDQTKVVLSHSNLPDEVSQAEIKGHWQQVLDNLASADLDN